MYLISTSFHADAAIFKEVMEIVGRVYLPMLEKAEEFNSPEMLQILVEADPEVKSFAVQARCNDLEAAMQWVDTEGAKFLEIMHRRYDKRLMFFTTPMLHVTPKK